MVAIRCIGPAPYGPHYFNVEGFRPIDFECPVCGLAGHWYKVGYSYNAKGHTTWKLTPQAVKYYTDKVKDAFPFAEDIFFRYTIRAIVLNIMLVIIAASFRVGQEEMRKAKRGYSSLNRRPSRISNTIKKPRKQR